MKYGADVNARDDNDRTALMIAASYGHTESIRLLLNHGANINAATTEGMTALMSAQEGGYTEAANLISSYRHTKTASKPAANRKSVPAVRNEPDNTVVVLNQNIINIWHMEINFDVDILRQRGLNVHVRYEHGVTALHIAAYDGDSNLAEALLSHGADVNAKDDEGHTPLFYAARFGHSEAERADTARVLINHGADVDAKDNDTYTALFFASCLGHSEVVKILLENKAHVNWKYSLPGYSE